MIYFLENLSEFYHLHLLIFGQVFYFYLLNFFKFDPFLTLFYFSHSIFLNLSNLSLPVPIVFYVLLHNQFLVGSYFFHAKKYCDIIINTDTGQGIFLCKNLCVFSLLFLTCVCLCLRNKIYYTIGKGH